MEYRFSSKGMTEQELLTFSKERDVRSIGCMEPELYGLGREIRRYSFYPKGFPLFVSSEHGIALWDYPQNYNLTAGFPSMLVHSERMKKAWEERSKTPCFVMQSPFVIYRRRKGITQSPEAKGSLAFFGHSTKEIDIFLDIDNYIQMLKRLPEGFQPVSICMHYADIQKGYYKEFLERSFKVYTAGNWLDKDFIQRFYEILRNFKYTTSNLIGSYTFYSVEMGIPFSKYGPEPEFYNKADTSFPLGKHDFKVHKQFAMVDRLFEGLHQEITSEQKSIVESELGINDGVGRARMAVILYGALLKRFFSGWSIGYILNRFYSAVPPFLKYKIYFLRNGLNKEAKIVTHLTPEEKITLHSLAKHLGPGSVAVEIGAYLGASSCFLAKGLLRNKGELYCIDTWQNQTMPEGEMDTFNAFVANTARYRSIIKPLKGLSETVVNDFAKLNKKIKLLFIDGDHSYKACRSDWELYSPFLSNNAIVVFHDTGWADGVNKVISEYVVGEAMKIIDLPNMQAYRIT